MGEKILGFRPFLILPNILRQLPSSLVPTHSDVFEAEQRPDDPIGPRMDRKGTQFSDLPHRNHPRRGETTWGFLRMRATRIAFFRSREEGMSLLATMIR